MTGNSMRKEANAMSTAILRKIRAVSRREEGQAGFEFLLMLPIAFVFFLMVLDFGVTMYKYVSVTNAVREGARWAAVNCGSGTCTASAVQTRVVARSGGAISDTGDVTVGWFDRDDSGSTTSDRGDSVIVKVSHEHSFIFIPAVTWTINSCADMRLEQKDKASSLPSIAGC